jgi:hypothetical protein
VPRKIWQPCGILFLHHSFFTSRKKFAQNPVPFEATAAFVSGETFPVNFWGRCYDFLKKFGKKWRKFGIF